MFQTVTQNSALSQNWVGCTRCTPWPNLRAHWRALHHVASLARPCCSLWPIVSWPCRRFGPAVSQRTPGRVALYAEPAPLPRPCSLLRVSQLPTLYRGTSLGHVVPVSRYNPAAKPPSCNDTIYCIATHSPAARPLCAGWPCHGLARLCRGPLCCAPSHACHDTNHCIVTQSWRMGSSLAS